MKVVTVLDDYPHITGDELRFAARFMSRLMIDEELHEQLYLSIRLTDQRQNEFGRCQALEQTSKPKRFSILAHKSQKRNKLLHTVAHELVHLKQMAMGEMGVNMVEKNGAFYTRWMGELYEDADMHYYDYPWEIEAHGREVGLVKRYRKFVRAHKLTFTDE